MRKCPFCNKKVAFKEPFLHQFKDDDTWSFTHYCNHEPDKLGVVITIYGESKKEILAKWDGVCRGEEQTDDSL